MFAKCPVTRIQFLAGVQMVLREMKIGDGQMPILTHKTVKEVSRFLDLQADRSTRTWKLGDTTMERLQAAGLNSDGRLVDDDKLGRAREILLEYIKEQKAKKRRKRQEGKKQWMNF